MISKSVLEKMRENDVNEFGCRGVIINLIHLSTNYDDKYFAAQDDFAKQYEIDDKKIDDQVFELADQLTANRIRCNTIMVDDKVDPVKFADLANYIIQDQYVAGQVINMEDKLVHKTPTLKEVLKDVHEFPDKEIERADQPYSPPSILSK